MAMETIHKLLVCTMIAGFLSTTGCHAQEPQVGSRVEVDPSEIGVWQAGTLKSVDPMRGYVVQLDAGYEVTIPPKRGTSAGKLYIRPASASGTKDGGAVGTVAPANPASANSAAPGAASIARSANLNGGGAVHGGPVVGIPSKDNNRTVNGKPVGARGPISGQGPLTRQIVEQCLENEVVPSVGSDLTYNFKNVQIAPPRAPRMQDYIAGIGAGQMVYEVRADFSTTLTCGAFKQSRDNTQYYLFFKDSFGNWTFQRQSNPNNRGRG